MRLRRAVPGIVLSALLAASLSACGSSSQTRVETQTTGQQLIDLKKALDEGVINQKEYDAKRRAILRGR